VHPAVVAATFGTIFVAELPDKTMLATIVISARFKRPFAVWAGAASALTTQMLIAVVAGRLLELLPERPVRLGVAVLFAVGAIVLWRSSDEPLEGRWSSPRSPSSPSSPPFEPTGSQAVAQSAQWP
jgi:putative Ca2+/H+ antiporter (TMEM165/GDT1 family)